MSKAFLQVVCYFIETTVAKPEPLTPANWTNLGHQVLTRPVPALSLM